ncbi:unnamed protein product, partial [Ixodes pacificus]
YRSKPLYVISNNTVYPIYSVSIRSSVVVGRTIGWNYAKRVTCWNAPSGCGFVGPVSSLLDHFGQCTFHTVSCPQCRSTVARSGVVRHCRDGCSSCLAADTVANNDLRLERDSIERARDELKEAMEKISEDLTFLQSGLNQCCEDIRATRATDASRDRLL